MLLFPALLIALPKWLHFQLWDANTGQGFSRFTEHEKRAWSVDFSLLCPTKFASGSDDCSVKLWSINEVSLSSLACTHSHRHTTRLNIECAEFA